MAAAADIERVRVLANVPDATEPYTDAYLGQLVDELGSLDAAVAATWRTKAAQYAELVTQSEAGSSMNFSDLHKNALRMASDYEAKVVTATTSSGGTRVSEIVRE